MSPAAAATSSMSTAPELPAKRMCRPSVKLRDAEEEMPAQVVIKRKGGQSKGRKAKQAISKEVVQRDPAPGLVKLVSDRPLFYKLFIRRGFLTGSNHEVMALGSTCKAFLDLRNCAEELDVDFNVKIRRFKFPSRFMAHLADCSNLQQLTLKNMSLRQLNHELADALVSGGLRRLKRLHILKPMKEGFASTLAALVNAPLPALRSLGLEEMHIGTRGWSEVLKALSKNKNRKTIFHQFEHLTLSEADLGHRTALTLFDTIINSAARGPPLLSLCLTENRIGEKAVLVLAEGIEIEAFPDLQVLRIQDDRSMTDRAHASLISALAIGCPLLKELALGTKWTTIGLQTLKSLTNTIKDNAFQSLAHLTLTGSRGDQGDNEELVSALELSSALPRLRVLNLSRHNINYLHAKRIVRLCLRRVMGALDLSHQGLSSAAIMALSGVIKRTIAGDEHTPPVRIRKMNNDLRQVHYTWYYDPILQQKLTPVERAEALSGLLNGLDLQLDQA